VRKYRCPECDSELEVRPAKNHIDKNADVPVGFETVCDYFCLSSAYGDTVKAALIEHMEGAAMRSNDTLSKALLAWVELIATDVEPR
jgi:hypothetical protein